MESKTDSIRSSYKICYECLVKIPIDAKKCSECGSIVGPMDHRGMAKKPTNWSGYLFAAIFWVVLFFFVKWAFF